MVRPAARYRPGARRFGGLLVPVFVVEKEGSGLREIWSGATGLVASINPIGDSNRTLAPTTPLGIDDMLVEYLGGSAIFVREQAEDIREENDAILLGGSVINGVLHMTFLRYHRVFHQATVKWSLKAFGVPLSTIYTNISEAWFSAVYDIATYSVDLQTAQISCSPQVFYTFSAKPTAVEFGDEFVFTATDSVTPIPQAISDSLPATHPYKPCGQLAWSPVEYQPSSGSYSSGQGGSIGVYFRFEGDLLSQMPVVGYRDMTGLNTISSQRVLSAQIAQVGDDSRLYQLADFSSGSEVTPCQIYPLMAETWADTYSDYSSTRFTDREEVFAPLDGMLQEDADSFLFSSQLPPPLPPDTPSGATTLLTTQNAVYFMESDVMLNEFGRFSFDFAQRRVLYYWIQD